jgi:hypothetical protein
MRFAVTVASLCALAGCWPLHDTRSVDVDLRPPQVRLVEAVDPRHLRISFDENATVAAEKTRITPALAVTAVESTGPVTVITGAPQVPGRAYVLETEALDARGNSSSFLAEFYGFNDSVPLLRINELSPRGSTTHPDLTEIAVLSDGNMGGVVLYNGTPGSFDSRLVFPAFAVRRGSFLVIHWKPSGNAGEVDETGDPAASTGLDARDTAWDFWVRDSTGLGGNNGVVSLYGRPGGACADAVLYSNRTSQSDQRYRGFGSDAMLARAEEIVAAGGWKAAGARVSPEDAVSPEGSTATRSLCRSAASADTDTASDWHIVPTGKATFGAVNVEEVYSP